MPCSEAVCTIFMMVFGMTRPRGELTTFRARGGHATDWANPTRSRFYRRNQIPAMLADSRCIEGEVPGYCPPPPPKKKQHGGYVISSIASYLGPWSGPPRGGLVVSVCVSHAAYRGFASRSGHTNDHHKNGTSPLARF